MPEPGVAGANLPSFPFAPAPHLAKKPKIWSLDGGTLTLNFHSGQAQAWRSEKRFVFVVAGTQGGKTSFGPWWLWREIQRCGPGDYLAASATYDLFNLKMLPEMKQVFEQVLGIGRYWSGSKVIEIADPTTGKFLATKADDPMWARIILRSASAEGGLESATALAAWLDEVGQDEFSLDAWQAVLRRVSLNMGRILGTTTPYNLGWLKQQVIDRWVKGDPETDVINFPSTTNPAFPHEEFEAARLRLPDWKFRMFYLGQFERPAGLIYVDFKNSYRSVGGHRVESFTPPPEWPRIVGVDPGAVHQCLIWLAKDPITNVFYAYREKLGERLPSQEHAKRARQQAADNHERVVRWYVGAKSEVQQRLDWQAAGVRPVLEPPVADVEAGIDRVIALFRQGRLFVSDDCPGLLDELVTYSRVLGPNGEPTEAIKDKQTFHHLDALRYACAGGGVVGSHFG